jgi:hypothetical protein
MVSGGLLMMQPNFGEMTDRELKDYALTHREDDDVFEELIKRVETSEGSRPYPETDEDLTAMEQSFLQSIARKSRA